MTCISTNLTFIPDLPATALRVKISGPERRDRLFLGYKITTLSDNYIKTIPPRAFSELLNLQSLDLSWNYIETFDPLTFEGLNSLTHLDLSVNHFQIIPTRALSKLPNLQRLNLSYSGLVPTIPSRAFFELSNLQSLDLSRNTIETFDPLSFEGLDSLTHLDLSLKDLWVVTVYT